MYKVMVYDRKDDSEQYLGTFKCCSDAKTTIETIKRVLIIFSDEEDLTERLQFSVRNEEGLYVS